jgi:thioredoxin reductase (NADPH)
MPDKVEKIVIIGSGPAAWTAAIYAARANLTPLVFPGRPTTVPTTILPGGQLMLTTEIENFPGFPHGITGPKLMSNFEQQAVHFGTRIQTDDGQHPDVSDADDGHSYKYHDCRRVDLSTRPFRVYDEDDTVIQTHALVIATGATANWLNLPERARRCSLGRLSQLAVASAPVPCATVPCPSSAIKNSV